MAVIQGNAHKSSVTGFYPKPIDQSLRFNDNVSASAYLSRTPASAGDRQKFTISTWLKRGALGVNTGYFSVSDTASKNFEIFFNTSNQLEVAEYDTSAFVMRYVSTQVFRDPSAYMHISVAIDTTQGTPTDRVKIFVNGVQLTAFGTATAYTLNANSLVNTTNIHYVGVRRYSTSYYYFDGYLAEVHFLNGIAEDQYAFGELKEGVWVAKAYTGAHDSAAQITAGTTNGFHLDFATSGDGTTEDISGNGNNWTENNLTASDVVLDSPTDNYATLNPLAKDSDVTLSDGNLKFSCSGAGAGGAIGTIAVSSGKWYWEVDLVSGSAGTAVGIAKLPLTAYAANQAGTYLYLSGGSKRLSPSTTSSYGASFADGDVIGVALDMDAGSVAFYKNEVSQGDAFTGLSGDFTLWVQDGSVSNASVCSVNCGQQDFDYTPPSGYLALSTANLPDPAIDPAQGSSPEDYFNTVLYTGNDVNPRTISTELTPDFTWIKTRSVAQNHALYDVLRGDDIALRSNTTDAESQYGTVELALETGGFTTDVPSGTNSLNALNRTYVAWNWKANGSGVSNTDGSITSTVSANTESGFSIVTTDNHTGSETVGHGLNQAPDLIIGKARDSSSLVWPVYHSSLANTQRLRLNDTTAAETNGVWGNTDPTDDVFTFFLTSGTQDYVFYCFHSVEGFSKFGSYTGNGSTDGPFVYTGFRPAFVMVKNTGATQDWYIFDAQRPDYNPANLKLYANEAFAENGGAGGGESTSTNNIDLLSNGFKLVTGNAATNESTKTFIYMAFAENPFKYSNAR